MDTLPSYRIFPLSDAAITIDFGNTIDAGINQKVLSGFHQLRQHPLPGMIEVAPAYSSLTVYYDIAAVKKAIPAVQEVYTWMKEQLEKMDPSSWQPEITAGRHIRIPVCYEKEFAPDLASLAAYNNTSAEEVVRLHTAVAYRVYMLGFLPGFAYMGVVDEKIRKPRKATPSPVSAGSVGVAGSQTGIYSLPSPGGWHIIGCTPLAIFDADRPQPALLEAGDTAQFYPISRHEFESY